jgi:hypothetical protein
MLRGRSPLGRERSVGRLLVGVLLVVGVLGGALAVPFPSRPAVADEPLIGVPFPATYFTGSTAPDQPPGRCTDDTPSSVYCLEPDKDITVTLSADSIFVGETITATATTSRPGTITWTPNSFHVSGCGPGDTTCTFKPYSTGTSWASVGAYIDDGTASSVNDYWGTAAYHVGGFLIEGDALIEDGSAPPIATEPVPYPTVSLRLIRTDANGQPTESPYDGLYNASGQLVDTPPSVEAMGACYFCSIDLRGLIWLDAATGRFRGFVPEGTYTLMAIRSPQYGEFPSSTPLPGWGTPITFTVDRDTEIHLRRDLTTIEGRVTAPNGQPLPGVRIFASPLGATGAGQGTTDAQGRYTMLVERGTYRLLPPTTNGRFQPTSRDVDTSQGNVSDADFVQETTRVEGWLYSDSGTVPDWPVEAIGPTTESARSDADGYFLFELAPGASWNVGPVGGVWDPPNQQIQLGSAPQQASFTCLDDEQCSVPRLSISYVSGPSRLEINQSGTFRFAITNHTEQAISDLLLSGPDPVSGSGIISVVSGPTPEPPTELAASETIEIEYVVTADAPGAARFSWSVTGTADGESVVDSVARDLQLGEPPLVVTVTVDPPGIGSLTYDDEFQSVPQPVTATVTLTNEGPDPIENIDVGAALGLESLTGPVPGLFPLRPVAGSEPSPSRYVDSLAPGASVPVTYQLEAVAPGVIEISALVTSGVGTVTGSTTMNIASPHDLLYRAELVGRQNGDTVEAGTSWEVLLTLKNVSDDTLAVRIGPATSGNAGGGVPRADAMDAPDSAVGIRIELPADSNPVVLSATIDTAAVGGTLSGASWTPHVSVVPVDGSPEVALDPARVLVAEGSGPFLMKVAPPSVPPPPPLDVGSGLYLWLESIGEGLVKVALTCDALGRALMDEEQPTVKEYLIGYYAALWTIARDLTAGEWAMVRDYAVEGMVASGFQAEEAYTAVDQFIYGTMLELVEGYYTWGWRELIRFTGNFVGENYFDIVGSVGAAASVAVLRSTVSPDLGLVDNVLARQAAEQEATVAQRMAQGVNLLDAADPIDFAGRKRLWGVDPDIDAALLRISKKWGILIGIRARAMAAAEWVGGIPKPPALNMMKSVTDMDVRFLGYVDEGTLVLRPPRNLDDALAAAAGEPQEVLDEIRRLHAVRTQEWEVHRLVLEEYQRNGIDVPLPDRLDGAHNSVPNFDASVYGRRELRLREIDVPEGDGFVKGYAVEIRDPAGEFQRVVSDVDLAYIGYPGGRIPSPAIRAAIGEDLAAAGIQHFETYTYLKQGTRDDILRPFLNQPGNPALLVYHPSGSTRAARFDPAKSIFGEDPGEPSFVYLDGAEWRPAVPDPSIVISPRDVTAPPTYVSPSSIHPSSGPTGLEFDRSPDAVVATLGDGMELATWTEADGWQPLTDATHDGLALPTLPQTSLSADVPAGATELPINELAAIAPEWAASGEDIAWFEEGDVIVLDPGGANEELATIAGFGSLILAEPTERAHERGEMVSVVPSVVPDTTPPSVSCAPAPTTWSNQNVSIDCTATDEGSGLADPSQASFALQTQVPDGTETADAATGSATVCDVAGSCTTAGPISGVRVDRAPPTIDISTPQPGARLLLGSTVAPVFECRDGGSGVTDCAGPATLDTSTLGRRELVVTASDAVGYRTSVSVEYEVVAPSPRLMMSLSAQHTVAVPLTGQRLTAPTYIFVERLDAIARVDFRLDASRVRTVDRSAPWNFLELFGIPLPLLPTTLSRGTHTMTAVVTYVGGRTETITATFQR